MDAALEPAKGKGATLGIGGHNLTVEQHGAIKFPRIQPGHIVWKTNDPELDKRVRQTFEGDQIRYRTEPNGRVYIEAVHDGPDPALGAFLQLLEADIHAHPERLKAFDGALHERLKALVGDVEVDLDATLSADDE